MSTIIKIQHLRGTAAQWTDRNPILPEGEFGIELDTAKIKAGNGIDNWVDLDYVGDHITAGSVNRIEQAITWTTDTSDYYFDWTHNFNKIPQIVILEGTDEVEVQVTHTNNNTTQVRSKGNFSNGKIVATY